MPRRNHRGVIENEALATTAARTPAQNVKREGGTMARSKRRPGMSSPRAESGIRSGDGLLTAEDVTSPTALGSAITAGTLVGIVAGPMGALAGTMAGGLVGAALYRWSERRARKTSAPHLSG